MKNDDLKEINPLLGVGIHKVDIDKELKYQNLKIGIESIYKQGFISHDVFELSLTLIRKDLGLPFVLPNWVKELDNITL